MFGFIKKLFGSTPAETTAEAPYKIEEVKAPVIQEVVAPVAQQSPKKTNAPAKKKPAGQKPAVKAKSARNRKPKSKPQA